MRPALRALYRHPASTALSIASLAAGLALIAAISSIAEAILFRSLPIGIVRIATATTEQPLGFVSYPDFLDYSRAARAAAQTQVLIAVGDPQRVRMGLAVTPNYFDVLGVLAAHGRTFAADDRAAVVLAYSYWRENPRAIGSTIRLGRSLFTVIGVAPENFGLDRFLHEEFYVPVAAFADGLLPVSGRPMEDRGRRFFTVFARGAKKAEIAAIGARLERDFPKTNRGKRAVVLTEYEARALADRNFIPMMRLAIAVGALIVLITAANFIGVRSAATRDESIRAALGASAIRLWRERFYENALIASAALAIGAPLGWAAARLIAHFAVLPADFHIAIEPRFDIRAAAFAALLGTAIQKARARRVLILVEVALATMLSASDAMLMADIAHTRRIDLGYRTNGIFVAALDPAQAGYDESHTRAYFEKFRVAALAQSVPLGYTGAQRELTIDGDTQSVWMNIVTPEYFDLLRIPIVEGRAFGRRDGDVAVVNREFAKRCGLGCKFRMQGRSIEVIGVVPTLQYFYLGEPAKPYFYLPYERNFASRMIVHFESGPEILRTLDPAIPVSEARMLADYVNQGATFRSRVGRDAVSIAGIGGLILAMTGLNGIVSMEAARRSRELAIRIALGSPRRRIVVLVLFRWIGLLVPAVAFGLAVAMRATPVKTGWLPPVGAAALVAIACLVAAVIPAWRASVVDPAFVLRRTSVD